MLIEVRKKPFHAYAEMQYYLDSLDIVGKYGATANFVGSMRDFNEDKQSNAHDAGALSGHDRKTSGSDRLKSQ